jgi:hypothetical protein
MKKFYAIKDIKSETFGTPFVIDNDEMAVREFSTLVQRPGTGVHMYPEDHHLYCLGVYDSVTGIIDPLLDEQSNPEYKQVLSPKLIAKGEYFKTKDQEDQMTMLDNGEKSK